MTAACAMASFGSCVQVHHGATCRRPMVPHDVLQSLGSVDDGVVALICATCQRSTSGTRRVLATVHGVVFQYFGWEHRRGASVSIRPPREGCVTRPRMKPRRAAWNCRSTCRAPSVSSPVPRAHTHSRRSHARSSAGRRCPRCLNSSPRPRAP
jgi:hypothetical protein